MSLIPSESYSFPDHFTTTVVPSRQPKAAETSRPQAEKKPAIVPLPAPEPAVRVEKLQPPPLPRPNPALLRANAKPRIPEPPKITASPKILGSKTQTRVPGLDPAPPGTNGQNPVQQTIPQPAAKNVIPMKPVQSSSASSQAPATANQPIVPRVPAQTQSVRATPRAFPVQHLQPEFFEILAQNTESAVSKRRQKSKFRRFVVCESAAVAVLLPLAIIGLLDRPSNTALLWIMNLSTIAMAIAVALIPILFYAFTPTLPEIEE
jgi:hypothetical protein